MGRNNKQVLIYRIQGNGKRKARCQRNVLQDLKDKASQLACSWPAVQIFNLIDHMSDEEMSSLLGSLDVIAEAIQERAEAITFSVDKFST